jgi:hypothetical protein
MEQSNHIQQGAEEARKKKIRVIIILSAIVVFILVVVGIVLLSGRREGTEDQEVISLFPSETGESTGGGSRSGVVRVGITGPILPTEGEATERAPVFRQLSTVPVVGATSFVNSEGVLVARFAERGTGFTYETPITEGSQNQLTNTRMSGVEEAYWLHRGTAVILRSLGTSVDGKETIKTTYAKIEQGTIGTSTSIGQLRGQLLPDGITSISVHPDGTSYLYLLRTDDGISGTIVGTAPGSQPREIFRHTFREWTPQLLQNGKVFLTTKPANGVPGYAYKYDPSSRTFERVFRAKDGLTTKATYDGRRIAFSESDGNSIKFGYYEKGGVPMDEGLFIDEATLGTPTLAEKCAWGSDEESLYCAVPVGAGSKLPDDWYQGKVSLRDVFYRNDLVMEDVQLLGDPDREVGVSFDADLVQITPNDEYLLFVDRTTGFLWSLRIDPTKEDDGLLSDEPQMTEAEARDAAGSTENTPN